MRKSVGDAFGLISVHVRPADGLFVEDEFVVFPLDRGFEHAVVRRSRELDHEDRQRALRRVAEIRFESVGVGRLFKLSHLFRRLHHGDLDIGGVVCI